MRFDDPVADAADFYAAESARAEAIEAARPYAENALCQDLDTFSDWLAGEVGKQRVHCAYFDAISTQELVWMLLNPCATSEQVSAARIELRRRYLADNAEAIAIRAQDMADC